MSLEVVETREQADLREHAHAGDEDEADMLGTALDDAVEPALVIPVGPCEIGVAEHVEDRLVVFVNQNGHLPPGGMAQAIKKIEKAFGSGTARRNRESGVTFDHFQLREDAALEILRINVLPPEAESHHRMGGRPGPVSVNIQTPIQYLVSLEQGLQRIQQEALAEPAWPGQETIVALVDQFPDEGVLST